jgi:hypothetical protein
MRFACAQGDFVVVADNGVGMQGRASIEWSLLAEGPEELPSGDAAVAFFNTGHVAALSALAHEIIIATARGGVGTLVRWGQPVTAAVHRELRVGAPGERTLKNAAIEFDMATGALRIEQPKDDGAARRTPRARLCELLTHRFAHAVERSHALLSQACFGLSPAHARLALADSFPMNDVTPAKLFSLFDPLRACGHGTVVYFTPRADDAGAPLVAPTLDGRSVRAGDVALHDFLPRAWMLPRSCAMPVEADYGAPVKRNKLPFVVTLQGPHGETDVDFGRHPWQRVVADGYASPPQTLQVPYGDGKVATVHVQFGWREDDEHAGIYLHRHKRFAKVEPHVHRLDSADAGALRQCIGSWKERAHEPLCRIYGAAAPLTKAQLKERTMTELQHILLRQVPDHARVLPRLCVAGGQGGIHAQRAVPEHHARCARRIGAPRAGAPLARGVRCQGPRGAVRAGPHHAQGARGAARCGSVRRVARLGRLVAIARWLRRRRRHRGRRCRRPEHACWRRRCWRRCRRCWRRCRRCCWRR